MRILLTILTLLCFGASYAQDSIQHRVIFIGDAGEMNPAQQKALIHASNHILQGKTTVMYLGDNVYPRGMALPDAKNADKTKQILQSQFQPMRAKGAPVYFVPGNHDWDKMGPKGLSKIKYQWQYLEEQNDSLLKLIPPNGCPDPVEIHLTNDLVIIAFDSEWWLFPFDKKNEDADCDCYTKKDVLAKLAEMRYRNRGKIVLLASHHPFQSYGVHGGKFTWKDHIFPLTSVSKNLYIPLPGIGSLYPFLRSTFPNPEDLKHPLYKDMINRVDAVFEGAPNLVHVAGHEHGLQFIEDKGTQVVSGAGAKHTNAKKGKGSLFADATQGYVTVDLLNTSALRVTYYIYEDDTVHQAFTYTIPYAPEQEIVASNSVPIKEDSVVVSVHAAYDSVGKTHRFFFGENYRKEWAAPTKLPVLRISELYGGLKPLQLGGGMQSKSLRLEDKDGKEWVIRSVEKLPDALLPDALKGTFARDWLDDVTSGQHPFSALVVPPIANAVRVPHASPVIGVLSPDKNLGMYGRVFSNLVVLLEEREPLGKSDNSEKMKKNLQKDNDNQLHAKEFLRARMLDALLGDWDRHEDQWRWYNDNDDKKAKEYLAVPRDRDQVFHVVQGFIPKIVSKEYVLPTFRNFDAEMSHEKWLLYKTRFGNVYPEMQFTREEWKKEADKFAKAVTDSVIEEALKRLPAVSYAIRHDELTTILRARRDRLSETMLHYYDFIQKIVDIRVSNKNELVEISDTPDKGMNIRISKINKDGKVKDELMNKTYPANATKEVRLYLGDGNDSVILNSPASAVKLRIIGGDDSKSYNIVDSKNKVKLYDKNNGSHFTGDTSQLKRHISDDSLNTSYTQTNLYNIWMPMALVGINIDDGLIIGAGFKYTKQEGFRKFPYASMHQLVAGHSFSTKAYRIRYNGEWIDAVGKADFTLQAVIRAPNNTINFFGRGNETVYDKTGDYKRYYRTRYGAYQLDPALRWNGRKDGTLSIGPSLYYYAYDSEDNKGRFIENTSHIGSYDSLIIDKNKLHLGGQITLLSDKRNSKVIPQWGTYVSLRIQAYKGIGEYANDFMQFIPEVALYKSLNPRATVVLAERFGGTVSVGKTTFYQSAFIGGQENLLGYRQYRFAGQHSFYNNLELRIKLADVANYILPGQLGLTGFWDIGRVWEVPDNSNKWHNGVGGGIYFAPASMLSFNFVMGYSPEGWYPYFTMGFRF
ncbi:BamA/TamA family outer membrane protein [Pinibacter soli]|uniref:Metallophosphoesterase n=1 Tax=Pinibacter soli TaxID=3044211 RepID=A0ABT6RFV8_9BACT|nr:BamA/TamA family outer membrane protein [Pinibacter soli]MDI3321346.1 metallophosphoesterase [Pinibacter soli]